jgi:hypothetical protein
MTSKNIARQIYFQTLFGTKKKIISFEVQSAFRNEIICFVSFDFG